MARHTDGAEAGPETGAWARSGRHRKLKRRSFLAQVIGCVGLAAFAEAAPARGAQSDADTGPSGDPARPPRNTISDADTGPRADPPRSASSGPRYTGVTDRDRGANADPRGHGRGPRPVRR